MTGGVPQAVRVLLVEHDDEDAAAFARLARAAPGFPETLQVERVRCAAETRACLAGRAPDAIVVSARNAGDDGIELIRELRAGGLAIPMLVLAAQSDEQVAVRALKAGAADYLTRARLTPDGLGRALRHGLEVANEAGLRRRAEEALRLKAVQLEEARRMEALATLAAGLAHEFNNRLNVISGHAELARRRLPADSPVQRHLGGVLQAAAEMAELTQRVQAFSRRQVLEVTVLELNELVGDWLRVEPQPAGRHVEVSLRCAPETLKVKADARRLRQVLTTLARNAADAMGASGRLQLETAAAALDAASGVPLPPGEYARLSVFDSGPGIPSDVRTRMFDPFFTTHGRSEASGMGLAAAYGIVKQSGGEIWSYSEPGTGTSFKIYLPRVDDRGEPWSRPPSAPSRAGSETLLLVEDDHPFREALRETLSAAGFFVLDAGNAAEALRLAEGHAGPIHALISDVMLPGMDGPALVGRLAAARPELRALLMSGLSERARGTPLPAALIEKPFSAEALLARLRELLDGPA